MQLFARRATLESRLLIDNPGAGVAAAQLGGLAEWLRHERELRGRVRSEHGDMAGDQMGGLPEALVVAISSGGAVTVLARAAVEWVRHRTHDVTLKVVRASGETFEVSVQRASSSDTVITELTDFLRGDPQSKEHDETA